MRHNGRAVVPGIKPMMCLRTGLLTRATEDGKIRLISCNDGDVHLFCMFPRTSVASSLSCEVVPYLSDPDPDQRSAPWQGSQARISLPQVICRPPRPRPLPRPHRAMPRRRRTHHQLQLSNIVTKPQESPTAARVCGPSVDLRAVTAAAKQERAKHRRSA